MYERLCTWRAFSNPWTVARGRYDRWSKISVTLEDDSRTIMGAELTMSEKRSDERDINRNGDECRYIIWRITNRVGTKQLGNYYLNNDRQVRQSLWLIDSTPVPGSLLWQPHASVAERHHQGSEHCQSPTLATLLKIIITLKPSRSTCLPSLHACWAGIRATATEPSAVLPNGPGLGPNPSMREKPSSTRPWVTWSQPNMLQNTSV